MLQTTKGRSITLLAMMLLAGLAYSCLDESEDLTSPTREIETDTVVAGNGEDRWIGPYWPESTNGDCELNSNGPIVTLQAELYVEDTDLLKCRVYMKVEETERDWSTAEDSWHVLLYQAPTGWSITDVGIDPAFCHVQYIDDNNDIDMNYGGGFIFRSHGDVNGVDIICGRTPDENMTHVKVWIDTLYVQRERD